jgi:hypothetical protein
MKEHPLSPEEKAERILENFGRIKSVEPSSDFDSRMAARFDSEFSVRVKTPKWFWAAAAAILIINAAVAYNYSGSTSKSAETKTSNTIASYYFQGGTDWYQQ